MKIKFLYILLILIITTLAACGTAQPALSSEDIANTAVADAWIAITQTQAAIPTATLAPPTATSEPTLTPFPTLPPLPVLPSATVAAPATDPCNQVPPQEPQGVLVNVEFINQSDGQVNLSFGMSTPNDKSECVTYSFTFGKVGVPTTKVLAGCYWGYAWITGDEPSVARTGNTILCMTDTSGIYHIEITKERIEFK